MLMLLFSIYLSHGTYVAHRMVTESDELRQTPGGVAMTYLCLPFLWLPIMVAAFVTDEGGDR